MRYYDDINLGEEVFFDEEYRVTEEEIIEVGTRWDPQPFHTDPVAAKESMFGGLVASSAHLFSINSAIGNAEIDKDNLIAAVSALGFNNLQWHAPVRPNDVLKSKFTVTAMRESQSRPGLGIITSASEMYNQKGETVFTLECSYLSPKNSDSEYAK